MGSLKTLRDRLDLNEAMRFIGAEWIGNPHIAFDPRMTPQYRIRRACAHDGTLLFSMELMHLAFENLFNRSSYYVPMGPPPAGMQPKYIVGTIKRFSVYRKVQVPAGNIIGERECVVIPVMCEYVPLDAERGN